MSTEKKVFNQESRAKNISNNPSAAILFSLASVQHLHFNVDAH